MAGQSARLGAIVQLELFSVADYVWVQIDPLATHKIISDKKYMLGTCLGYSSTILSILSLPS